MFMRFEFARVGCRTPVLEFVFVVSGFRFWVLGFGVSFDSDFIAWFLVWDFGWVDLILFVIFAFSDF